MKFVYILSLFMALWGFLAQGCMSFRISDEMAKQHFKERGMELGIHSIKIDTRTIHYASAGDSLLPTLVFIHGTPGSWNAFMQYMQDTDLLKQFRIVSVDRPGFGYSDFGKVMNLSAQADILNSWMQKINNGKPVYLVGHSLGGPLIIKMAADKPGMYKSLVVISGSIDPDEEKAEKWRVIFFKSPLNYFLPGAFRPSNQELWYLKQDLRDLKADYSKVNIPVYFIHGDNDTWVPPGNVAFGKKMLVNAAEVGELMLSKGSHFIPWTHYNEIKDVLLRLSD
ncbi:MAG TPA: alpha/beta hydrolase [Chitinophagaceae bacterium]|nr:alpha/beta hydrolase [Chitinophagaceae bacterium]